MYFTLSEKICIRRLQEITRMSLNHQANDIHRQLEIKSNDTWQLKKPPKWETRLILPSFTAFLQKNPLIRSSIIFLHKN